MMSEKVRVRAIATVVVALIVSTAAPALPAEAEHAGEAAERAAREILDARDRANEAAQAMFDAESQLDSLTIELGAAEQGLSALEVQVSELRAGLTESAVRQYIGAGQDALVMFQDTGLGNDQATALVYAGAATGSELVRADDYEEAIDELDNARRALEIQRNKTVEAGEAWAALKINAEEQVLDLQRLEQDRLADAEVQHELERQRQARLEQERREQEQEAQRQAAAAAAAAKAAQTSPGSNGSSNPSDNGNSTAPGGSPGNSPAPATPSPPVPVPAPTPPSNAGAGMVCPVAGPNGFADTWGAPRSGGRSHEGVDMISPGGTPLVAAESGAATFKTNKLGGNAVWISGASGTRYYYAHLSAWEGSSRNVTRGEVIGYVGATGNTSVNHLHFEVHPNGGRAVNPYPYVRAVC